MIGDGTHNLLLDGDKNVCVVFDYHVSIDYDFFLSKPSKVFNIVYERYSKVEPRKTMTEKFISDICATDDDYAKVYKIMEIFQQILCDIKNREFAVDAIHEHAMMYLL